MKQENVKLEQYDIRIEYSNLTEYISETFIENLYFPCAATLMSGRGKNEKVNKERVKRLLLSGKILFPGIFSSSYYEVE